MKKLLSLSLSLSSSPLSPRPQPSLPSLPSFLPFLCLSDPTVFYAAVSRSDQILVRNREVFLKEIYPRQYKKRLPKLPPTQYCQAFMQSPYSLLPPTQLFGRPPLPLRVVRTLCTLHYYDSIGRGEPGNFFPYTSEQPAVAG